MRKPQRNSVSVLSLGLLALALLATSHVAAAGRESHATSPVIVETFGKAFTGGTDPVASQAEMAELYAWLWSERAATPLEPGISIELTKQDRIEIGEGFSVSLSLV